MEMLRKILIGLIIILILIVIEFIRPLRAEERSPLFFVGGFAGLNLNMHYSNFNRLGEEFYNCCPKFNNASGTGFSFGGLFELPIKMRLYFGARLGYTNFDATFSPTEFIGNTELRETFPPFNTISIAEAKVEHRLESRLSTIGLEPYIGFQAFKGLHTTAGFRLSYLFSNEFSQHEKLLQPDNVVFSNGSRIRNDFSNEEIPNANSIQLHGVIGFGYDLPVSQSSYLTPELKYYIPFTNVSDVDWKASSFLIGASLKTAIFPPAPIVMKDTIITRDTTTIVRSGVKQESIELIRSTERTSTGREGIGKVERTRIFEQYERIVPKIEDLAIDFQVFGVTTSGEKQENPVVIIEEIETEEGFPLLPYIFFSQGNSALENTRMELLSQARTTLFNEDDLNWNTMDIYQQLLNIVGKRLINNPSANITLTGTNNNTDDERNNLPLSRLRAFAVRDYLVNIWGINTSRIRIDAVNLPSKPTNPVVADGISENSRVEISSNDRNILAPVYLREVLRVSDPPLIEIHPAVQTSAGLTEFNLEISQGDSKIRSYTYNNIPEKYNWNIEVPPVPLLNLPADIVLIAKDNIGQSVSAAKQISISQKTIKTKREHIEGDYRVERYSLILFDFDKSEILLGHRYALDYIKSKITPTSLVTISGYADRTGTSDYNRELARRRSEEVMLFFSIPSQQVTILPIGSDELIFDNNLPEGRSYSRTVRIEIRTPVRD